MQSFTYRQYNVWSLYKAIWVKHHPYNFRIHLPIILIATSCMHVQNPTSRRTSSVRTCRRSRAWHSRVPFHHPFGSTIIIATQTCYKSNTKFGTSPSDECLLSCATHGIESAQWWPPRIHPSEGPLMSEVWCFIPMCVFMCGWTGKPTGWRCCVWLSLHLLPAVLLWLRCAVCCCYCSNPCWCDMMVPIGRMGCLAYLFSMSVVAVIIVVAVDVYRNFRFVPDRSI